MANMNGGRDLRADAREALEAPPTPQVAVPVQPVPTSMELGYFDDDNGQHRLVALMVHTATGTQVYFMTPETCAALGPAIEAHGAQCATLDVVRDLKDLGL